jgi:hypothetical protein
VQRHGTLQHIQQPSSGSTHHDRVTILQICSLRSLALGWPRQNTPRSPPVAANRPTICRARRHPPLIGRSLNHRTTRRTGSIQISQLARGTQIPIAPAAPPYVPSRAVSSLGGFRTPALGARGTVTHRAGIRNTSQQQTLPSTDRPCSLHSSPSPFLLLLPQSLRRGAPSLHRR